VRARRVLIALAVVVLATSSFASPADARSRCQCTQYVANYIGRMGIYAAKDAGPALRRMGHPRYWPSPHGLKPRRGDIIVFQPGVMWASRRYGHIGFVHSYSTDRKGRLVLYMRSANFRARHQFRDRGCTNVSVVRLPAVKWSRRGVAFYRR
jgi:surface antigen